MSNQALYDPQKDSYFSQPYIDVEEWREMPVRHYFIHGGFKGTEKAGNEVRFCFYFPEKEHYEGRFFQYLSPAPEDEHESEHLSGEDDKIAFALTHGAYYVITNQGGFVPGEGDRLYRSSANGAQFGRRMACKVYGYEHRPFGYLFGGSGGSFKTMSCMEMTDGVWDGAVPYVIGNPMATPNVFCPRVRVMRMLGEEGLKRLVDAMEPGGSGDIYEGLDEEQRQAVLEATKMGFPKRGWFSWPAMGDGALMVLLPHLYQVYPQYFSDFWSKPGFEGTREGSSEARARVRFETSVAELIEPEKKKEENYTSVDNSWINTMIGNNKTPKVRLTDALPEDAYLTHCRIRVLSGEAKGRECAVESIVDGVVTVSSAFDGSTGNNVLDGIAEGDRVMIDNSDYLAMQTFQRHQVPDESYHVYDQYRDGDGKPIYPQLPFLIAPQIAKGGGGCLQTGNIHGKIIAMCSLLDESALPWHGDWYRDAVTKAKGGNADDCFRLYYNDNCIHDDRAGFLEDPWHQVDYLGMLHQALLDMARWCEEGVAPVPSTNYIFNDGQIEVPPAASQRGGLQPVVDALANDQKSVTVYAGDEVSFTAVIEMPPNAGAVSSAAWDFEKTGEFVPQTLVPMDAARVRARVQTSHCFETPGTYFPVIKAAGSRDGSTEDIFVQCKNLDRVRVVVLPKAVDLLAHQRDTSGLRGGQ